MADSLQECECISDPQPHPATQPPQIHNASTQQERLSNPWTGRYGIAAAALHNGSTPACAAVASRPDPLRHQAFLPATSRQAQLTTPCAARNHNHMQTVGQCTTCVAASQAPLAYQGWLRAIAPAQLNVRDPLRALAPAQLNAHSQYSTQHLLTTQPADQLSSATTGWHMRQGVPHNTAPGLLAAHVWQTRTADLCRSQYHAARPCIMAAARALLPKFAPHSQS